MSGIADLVLLTLLHSIKVISVKTCSLHIPFHYIALVLKLVLTYIFVLYGLCQYQKFVVTQKVDEQNVIF